MFSKEHNFWEPQVMGVLNVTPDSFSEKTGHTLKIKALVRARQMINDGAHIIDIGGESTRPGADPVGTDEELARVMPVLETLIHECDVPISVDTRNPIVMASVLSSGASMINDVGALRAEGAIECLAKAGAPVCIMHMQGNPQSMQMSPSYQNVVQDIYTFLEQRIQAAVAGGVKRSKIIIDVGFGFGKTLPHNLSLLRNLSAFQKLECPILVGVSRKSMIGAILGGAPINERLYGSLAAGTIALMNGAQVLRVHDVSETVQALAIYKALYHMGNGAT